VMVCWLLRKGPGEFVGRSVGGWVGQLVGCSVTEYAGSDPSVAVQKIDVVRSMARSLALTRELLGEVSQSESRHRPLCSKAAMSGVRFKLYTVYTAATEFMSQRVEHIVTPRL
jgi:hypothetical protein